MYDYQPINKDSYEKNRFVIALFLCRLAGSTGGDENGLYDVIVDCYANGVNTGMTTYAQNTRWPMCGTP